MKRGGYTDLLRWMPFILWMGVIFWLSHRSFREDDPIPWIIQLLELLRPIPPDKVVHAVLYAILAFFGYFPLWNRPLLLGAICVFYGVTDEWHQSFVPTRNPDAWDVLADAVGALVMILFLVRIFPEGVFSKK